MNIDEYVMVAVRIVATLTDVNPRLVKNADCEEDRAYISALAKVEGEDNMTVARVHWLTELLRRMFDAQLSPKPSDYSIIEDMLSGYMKAECSELGNGFKYIEFEKAGCKARFTFEYGKLQLFTLYPPPAEAPPTHYTTLRDYLLRITPVVEKGDEGTGKRLEIGGDAWLGGATLVFYFDYETDKLSNIGLFNKTPDALKQEERKPETDDTYNVSSLPAHWLLSRSEDAWQVNIPATFMPDARPHFFQANTPDDVIHKAIDFYNRIHSLETDYPQDWEIDEFGSGYRVRVTVNDHQIQYYIGNDYMYIYGDVLENALEDARKRLTELHAAKDFVPKGWHIVLIGYTPKSNVKARWKVLIPKHVHLMDCAAITGYGDTIREAFNTVNSIMDIMRFKKSGE